MEREQGGGEMEGWRERERKEEGESVRAKGSESEHLQEEKPMWQCVTMTKYNRHSSHNPLPFLLRLEGFQYKVA